MAEVYPDELALIRYHTWWPGSADPFWLANTEDNEARIRYIGEQTFPGGMYTPHFVVDGYVDAEWNPAGFEGFIQQELAIASPIAMDLETALDFGRAELTVTCSGQPETPITGDLYLRFALTESDLHIPGDGDPYHEVMRDMFPDPQGIALDLSAGQSFSEEVTVSLNPAWILQNLEVVAFVQNDDNSQVFQAAKKKMPSDLPLFVLLSLEPSETGDVGDGDGVINPGEDGTFAISIMADSAWGAASNIVLSLTSLSEYVTVTAGEIDLPDLEPGESADVEPGELVVSVSAQAGTGNFPMQLDIMSTFGEGLPYGQTMPFNLLVSLNQQGYPVAVVGEVLASPALLAAGAGRQNAVIAVGDDDGYVHVLDETGAYLPGFPVQAGDRAYSPALADIDDDGDLEILVGSWDKHLYCFAIDGSTLWAADLDGYILSCPAVADVDGDGAQEVVAGTFTGDLWVLEADGAVADGWPMSLGVPKKMTAGFCLEDIDGDGVSDIVVGTWGGTVEAFHGDGSSVSGWPVELPEAVKGGVVSSVVQGAGPVLLAPCSDDNLYVLTFAGEQFSSVTVEDDIIATPTVSDLDGDGALETVIIAANGWVHVLDSALGELPGWPVSVGAHVESSPAIADLDGDGIAEILNGADDGKLSIFALDGNLVMNPLDLGARIRSTPALNDIDGDGDVDLIVGSGTSIVGLDFKTVGGAVEGFWSQYRAVAAKTGSYLDLGALSSPSGKTPVPSRVALYQPRPNPASTRAWIRFGIPSGEVATVGLYDISGRLVLPITDGEISTGTHAVTCDIQGVAQGTYFVQLSTETVTIRKPLVVLR